MSVLPSLRWPHGIAVLEDGQIRLVHTADWYDPFEAEDAVLPACLEFADLAHKNDEAVVEFIGKHGPLGISLRRLKLRKKDYDEASRPLIYPDANDFAQLRILEGGRPDKQAQLPPESLSDIRAEIDRMARVIQMWMSFASDDFDVIAEGIKATPVDELLQIHAIKEAKDGPNGAEMMKSILAWQLVKLVNAERFHGAWRGLYEHYERKPDWPTESLYAGGPPKIRETWIPRDLLAGLYCWVSDGLIAPSGLAPRRCGNRSCRKLFMPQRVSQGFCSSACRSAETSREYRERKRERTRRFKTGDEGRDDTE